MSEKLSQELVRVENKIKKRYFLIDFKEYESIIKDILKRCLTTYSEEKIVDLYKQELTQYFEPIQEKLKKQLAKAYMDNKFNFTITNEIELLNEIKKLLAYLKSYKIFEDYFLYDWIIQNYSEVGMLISSLLVEDGIIKAPKIKRFFQKDSVLNFLLIASDILDIDIEDYVIEESTAFNTRSLLKHSILTREKTNELFARYRDGDIAARDEIMAHNYRLVRRQVKILLTKIRPKSYTSDDLFQEGVIGLMFAVENFNPELGYCFSTYASWQIQKAIWNNYYQNDRETKMPVRREKIAQKIIMRKKELAYELGHKVTIDDLAKDMLMSATKIKEYLNSYSEVVSLQEQARKDEDNNSLEYIIPSDTNVEEDVLNSLEDDNVNELLSGFTPHEVDVIKMRAGIGYPRTYTLAEVGKKFNITREAVRQIEKKVRIKLNKKNTYVTSSYNTKISQEVTKIRLNDYFLGASNYLLGEQIAQLDAEKQRLVRLFYNRQFNLITFREVDDSFFNEIIDPIFKALYEKNGKLNLDAIPVVNINRLKKHQSNSRDKLIIKRYGSNLDELNPLDKKELRALYVREWPSFYNYCLKAQINSKKKHLTLRQFYSYLSEEELHYFIAMLDPDEQEKIYADFGEHLNEYNHIPGGTQKEKTKLDRIIKATMKPNNTESSSKVETSSFSTPEASSKVETSSYSTTEPSFKVETPSSEPTPKHSVPEKLKDLPVRNYMVYTMAEGIGYEAKMSISKIAEVFQISIEEIIQIYTETCQMLNNPNMYLARKKEE